VEKVRHEKERGKREKEIEGRREYKRRINREVKIKGLINKVFKNTRLEVRTQGATLYQLALGCFANLSFCQTAKNLRGKGAKLWSVS
jgi:hypothetical protein